MSWKIVGTYALPWGFNTGFYFRHENGGTWTATVGVPGLNQGWEEILAEPLGSRQIPSRNLLDLRVEKEFPIYSAQLRFTVDVFNVFNSAYPTAVASGLDDPNFGMPFRFTQPRQMRLGLRYTF